VPEMIDFKEFQDFVGLLFHFRCNGMVEKPDTWKKPGQDHVHAGQFAVEGVLQVV
jgi:hypothetical protein